MAKQKVVRGRDFRFKMHFRQKGGAVEKLTGTDFASLTLAGESDPVVLCSPLTAGVDCVQKVAFPSNVDAGGFQLDFGSGYVTPTIQFNDSLATIQGYINALKIFFGDVLVTGAIDSASGLTITYQAQDGKRAQPVPSILNNTLTLASAAVVPTVSVLTVGEGENGLNIDEEAGEVEVVGNQTQSALLETGKGKGGLLDIRSDSLNKNIPPIEDLIDVVDFEL